MPPENFTPVGVPGLKRAAGYLYEERMPELSGARGREVFARMRDDEAIVGAVLHAIEMLIRQVDWRVEPYHDPSKRRPVQVPVKIALPQPQAPGTPVGPPGGGLGSRLGQGMGPRGMAEPAAPGQPAARPAAPGPPGQGGGGPAPAPVPQRIVEVRPPKPEVEDDENTTFVRECLFDMEDTWEETLTEILTMLVYGWSYLETIYKRRHGWDDDPTKSSRYDDGKIGWSRWSIRAQDTLSRWGWSEDGRLTGMYQVAPPDFRERFIPMDRSLLFRTSIRKGNPEGRSILRNAYESWWYLRNIRRLEGIGIERDLAGIPVVWLPAQLLSEGATDAEKSALEKYKRLVTNLRRDEQEGIVMPLAYDDKGNKLYDITLMSAPGSRQFATDNVIKRYKADIAMSVIADFVVLGHESVGSFALSKSKMSIFNTSVHAWMDSIAGVVNNSAIPRLLKVNNMDMENLPRLTHSDTEEVDLTEVANVLRAIGPIFPETASMPGLLDGILQRLKLPSQSVENLETN